MSISELFSVAGKVAVVTGGSRGVGLMIARGFVEAGAKVYICARTAEVCDKVAAELSGLPGDGECVSLPTDLSTEDGCLQLAKGVAERETRLDILVNNAAIQGKMSMRRHDAAAWDDVLAVNLQGVFHTTKFFLPLLWETGTDDSPARVINVGSVTGLKAFDLEAFAYTSSKAAVHHLTAHLARRLAPRVTVNAMVLGPFESKMTEATIKVFGGTVAKNVPMKRIGRPEDVAGTAIWLSSLAGSYTTGALIPVEGGLSTID